MNRGLITAGDLSRDLEDKGFAVFMQDDWRVTPRFTVNLGLRYELTTVLTEANNLMGNFIPGQGLLQTGSSKLDKAFNGDHNNFAPRIGFAWDIGGNGKTVIRGGGGIYYEQGSFDSFMAIGNLLGLRTVPTGVNLYANGKPDADYGGWNHQRRFRSRSRAERWDRPPRPEPSNTGGRITVRVCRFIPFLRLAAMVPSHWPLALSRSPAPFSESIRTSAPPT